MSARSSSSPAPVRAETTIECFSWRRSRSSTSGSARSALLTTTISGTSVAPTSASTVPDGGDLALGVGVRAVDDVQEQVGLGDLLERGAERLDELVRQLRGRSRRCRRACRSRPSGGLGAAHRGVEGREQRVLDEHARAGEPVEQRATCRRWCSRRSRRDGTAFALRELPRLVSRTVFISVISRRSLAIRVLIRRRSSSIFVSPGPREPMPAPPADLATGLARHRLAPAAQAREEVLQLRELDLGLALPATWRAGRRCRGSARCGR